MAAKPLIGINTDFRPSRKEHAALSFVAAGYYDGITASGGIPVILPPLADEDDVIFGEGLLAAEDMSWYTIRRPKGSFSLPADDTLATSKD